MEIINFINSEKNHNFMKILKENVYGLNKLYKSDLNYLNYQYTDSLLNNLNSQYADRLNYPKGPTRKKNKKERSKSKRARKARKKNRR